MSISWTTDAAGGGRAGRGRGSTAFAVPSNGAGALLGRAYEATESARPPALVELRNLAMLVGYSLR
jgi:hypothetical protein